MANPAAMAKTFQPEYRSVIYCPTLSAPAASKNAFAPSSPGRQYLPKSKILLITIQSSEEY